MKAYYGLGLVDPNPNPNPNANPNPSPIPGDKDLVIQNPRISKLSNNAISGLTESYNHHNLRDRYV